MNFSRILLFRPFSKHIIFISFSHGNKCKTFNEFYLPVFFQTSDILSLHERICPSYVQDDRPEVMISLDGVSESKSTTNSLDVYTSRFAKCRNIYPHRIVKPLNRFPVENRDQFASFLEDLNQNNCHVTDFIGDNPKRAFVREALNHASYYACEYCEAKAVQFKDQVENRLERTKFEEQIRDIQEKIDMLQDTPGTSTSTDRSIEMLLNLKKTIEQDFRKKIKSSHLVWPSSTSNANLRTVHDINAIVHEIDNHETLTIDESKGFNGHSLLLYYDNFDFIRGISCEYMHCVCLGVIKRLLTLTFNLGEKRVRVTNRRLSNPSSYNNLMKNVRVPKEFSRRARNLDISVLKAQEMRNIALFFFPVVLQCIERTAKERRLWLLLSYVIRACCIPQEEFMNVDEHTILALSQQFYTLYEQLFSSKNCTYNTHVFSAHILLIRSRGPLTFTSAFPFEAFYAELRHSFTPGTMSPLKQMFQKVMLRRVLSYHCCETSIYFSSKDTQLECNSLIYTHSNGKFTVYKIIEIFYDHLICYKLGKYPVTFVELPNIDWSCVGVFSIGGISEQPTTIQKCHVKGKVIRIMNYYLTCPNNILREK